MLAFHSDNNLKTFVLAQLEAHKAADKIVKGTYWDNGKGCAVGCTLNSLILMKGKGAKARQSINRGDHGAYETHLGIPRILARVEDRLFEGMENGDSQEWPIRFIGAIKPGADLTMVWPRFALWLLSEFLPPLTKRDKTKASLAEVAALYREWTEGAKPSAERWLSAWRNAAAYAADADAAYAADAADAAYAAAAAYAAYAAAYAAAAYAADAYAAYAADAATARSARSAAYKQMADKLIEIMQAIEPTTSDKKAAAE